MFNYIMRRLLFVPFSLFFVMLLVFIVLRLTGDPVEIYLGINSTPEQVEILTKKLHLDEPLPLQFAIFLGNIVRGDFGDSLQFGSPAMPVVLDRMWPTIQLIALGLLLAVGGGVVLGIICAVRKDHISDFVISSFAIGGQSMPSFWLGILLIQIFALNMKILPTSGIGTFQHLILPTITLSMFLMPNFIMLTRVSFLETINEHFVVTARSKGVSPFDVICKHVLPNAINPVVSYLGNQIGRLFGGSIITETIFAWPGVGRLMIGSIFQRDVPVVVAAVFIVCITVILSNLIVDIVLSIIDPRIRLK